MSIGRIPFRAIDAYAERYGINGTDAFDRFRILIRAMDAVFLDHIEKRKTATSPSKTDDGPQEVSIHNTHAVTGILGRLKARANAVYGDRATPENESEAHGEHGHHPADYDPA